jgi:hypothetical protein
MQAETDRKVLGKAAGKPPNMDEIRITNKPTGAGPGFCVLPLMYVACRPPVTARIYII